LESDPTASSGKMNKREIYLSSPKVELLSSYGEQLDQEAHQRGFLRYSIRLKMEKEPISKTQ
jgi:hypothetical protein